MAKKPSVVRYVSKLATRVSFAQARKLDDTSQAQILTSLAIRNGQSFDDMETCSKSLAAAFECDEKSFTLSRYEITRKGDKKPSYVFWAYFDEHGVVCEIGKGSGTGTSVTACSGTSGPSMTTTTSAIPSLLRGGRDLRRRARDLEEAERVDGSDERLARW